MDIFRIKEDSPSEMFEKLSALDRLCVGVDGWSAESFMSEAAKDNGIVLFIMEGDPFKKGQSLYHFVRADLESGLALNDGSHIVYVNGAKRDGEDDLSRLMHDFFCTNPDDMYYEELAKVVRRFKQTSEGVSKMSSVVEEILAEGRIEGRDEGVLEEKKATVRQLLKMGGFSLESIAEITRLSLGEVRSIAAENGR